MTCRFSDIKFGEIVRLGGGQACCGGCGYNTQSIVEENEWKYVGHSGNLDLFQATKLLHCPSCGTHISGHSEQCGGLDYSQFFAMKAEPIKAEEIEP